MKIPLKEISTQGLLQLMQAVAAELEARINVPEVRREKQPDKPVVVLREPAEQDKAFCLHVAQKLRSGGYITADERTHVADVAKEFGQWVIAQRLPTERNTGPWRKAAEMYRIGFAAER